MNPELRSNHPPLLSQDELDALMQRKAALQAQLQAQAGAGVCGSTGTGACPSCHCGSSDSNNAEFALPTQKSRLLKIVLAALGMLLVVVLVLQL
ncbi:MAG: hypothetical protein PHX60_01845 [Giesbergeria sp.]|uniref:hypothetical protein n=1 Tax=Giesbergeria sp. TaxID=2818473 RepID=UPI002639E13C|nr:hypothetical protein [Giesbergeria sp.]MDD2608423.1 hypothetical protein [Giesbergeria sp.]